MSLEPWLGARLAALVPSGDGVPRLIEFALAALLAAAVFGALIILRRWLGRFFARRTAAAPTMGRALGALIDRTSIFFLAVLSLATGIDSLPLGARTQAIVTSLMVIALVLQAAVWASVGLTAALDHYTARRTDRHAVTTATHIVGLIGRSAIWAIALLLILENLGFNVTALVAGLGIGGIAIGLAAQKILGDLFASLSIVFDKPFEIGDFIVSDPHMGTVEQIGLKTTRLRSLSGEQIIIANADLLASRLRNFKRMSERRVAFVLRIYYGTPIALLARLPEIVETIIAGHTTARFERCSFVSYGDWSLNYEIVYFVLSPSYREYTAVTHAINLEIAKRFAAAGIAFALPSGQPARTADEEQVMPA